MTRSIDRETLLAPMKPGRASCCFVSDLPGFSYWTRTGESKRFEIEPSWEWAEMQ